MCMVGSGILVLTRDAVTTTTDTVSVKPNNMVLTIPGNTVTSNGVTTTEGDKEIIKFEGTATGATTSLLGDIKFGPDSTSNLSINAESKSGVLIHPYLS